MTQTPRQRRKAKNKENILNATAQLIVTKGFENVSLRDIAKRADYSPAGLYKYFENKTAIIEAVSKRENEKLLCLLETVPTTFQARKRLVEMCMVYVRFSLENQAFLSLVNNLVSKRKDKDQPVGTDSPYLVFYRAVQAWVLEDRINLPSHYEVEEVTYALWTLIHGMATLRFTQLKNFEADFDSANRETLEIFLSGLEKWAEK